MLKMLILAVKNALISKLKQMWQQGLNLNRFPLLYGKDTEKGSNVTYLHMEIPIVLKYRTTP